MSTFHITNFGCRATSADAAAIEAQLRRAGLAAAEAESAHLVVINTCTVTADADSAARQAIRAAHRANPAARIVVTGCYAQRAPEELAAIEGVAHVVGNSHQREIGTLAARAFQPVPSQSEDRTAPRGYFRPVQIEPAGAIAADSLQRPSYPMLAPQKILSGDIFAQNHMTIAADAAALPGARTRPVLKIQDGCNNRCSYCVIPFVRGKSRSLPPADVVGEVNRLCAAGAREIVLSGINLGTYGRDLAPRASLLAVLQRILDATPLERLRLSSVEPQDVTRELVDMVAAHSSLEGGRLARHFHVPLQSGSDRILAAMHRWYRAEHYAQRIELIHERIPGAAIGADVIVGFPGETEEDFAATRALIERLPFTYLHVFAFSQRPGTAAFDSIAGGAAEVPPQVGNRRSRELRDLAAEKSAAFRRSQAGATLRALSLHKQRNGGTEALTDNYLTLRVPGLLPHNQFVDARVT